MSVTTELLDCDKSGLKRAAELLRAGELVAFPTETVYGLGADAKNGEAVAAIYEAKGRPSFNPLIVHVPDIDAAFGLGDFPAAAEDYLKDGWPAGLTLVVPLRGKGRVSSLVTAGLATIALRVPAAPVAQALLKAFDGPIAAPSANPSGRISPTTAHHVLTGLGGRIAAVLDGGPAAAGLESTIIGFEEGRALVLREGACLVPDDVARRVHVPPGGQIRAPGQLASHYAPSGSLRTNARKAQSGEWHLGFGDVEGDVSLSRAGDLREAAASLFSLLHEADARGVAKIAVAPIPNTGLGRAINDRLARAAAPR